MKPSQTIFLVIANDKSKHLPLLQEESKRINKAFLPLERKGIVRLIRDYEADLDHIYDILLTEQISILHFAGHANSTGVVIQGDLLKAKGFANLFSDQNQLRLVFLNGCSSQGQVTEFLEAGAKAVIGTRVQIADDKALKFADAFYRALAAGFSLESSFYKAKSLLESLPGFEGSADIQRVDLRSVNWRKEITEEFSWNLFVRENESEILKWQLKKEKKPPWYYPIRVLVGIGLIVLLYGLSEWLNNDGQNQAEDPEPRATWEVIPLVRDLDTIHLKGTKTDTIRVKNKGASPLNISTISLSGKWGRILQPLSGQLIIGPGLSELILVQIIAPENETGHQEFPLWLESRDPRDSLQITYQYFAQADRDGPMLSNHEIPQSNPVQEVRCYLGEPNVELSYTIGNDTVKATSDSTGWIVFSQMPVAFKDQYVEAKARYLNTGQSRGRPNVRLSGYCLNLEIFQ